MADVDFSDFDAAVTWFAKQRPKMRCAIISRAALRVFSNIVQDDPIIFDSIALWQFRSVLTTAARATATLTEIEVVEAQMSSAFDSGSKFHDTVEMNAGTKKAPFERLKPTVKERPAFAAFRAALRSTKCIEEDNRCGEVIHISAHAAAYSTSDDDEDVAGVKDLVFRATSMDAKPSLVEGLTRTSVWNDLDVPNELQRNHEALLGRLSREKTWTFWHDWYLGMWNGTFDDWGLATEVAKIPNEIWEQGAEAIAAEIEKIQIPINLKKEVSELKRQLDNVADRHNMIGHNRPPEPIEKVSLHQIPTVIWVDIGDLETQLALNAPDIEAVQRTSISINKLAEHLRSFIGDTAYDFAKDSAKFGLGGAAIAAWPKILALLNSISLLIDKWLGYLIVGSM